MALNIGELFAVLEADTTDFDKGMTKAQKSIGIMEGAMIELGRIAVQSIGSIARSTFELAKGFVDAGSEFENAEAQLTTLLGSTDLAAQRLDELFRIGATTPFELAGLVEAETKLVAFGDRTGELREGMLNLAAGLNLDVADAADAVGRAFAGGAGAADILRERGVLAMVEMRAGVKATELSLEEFREVLKETLEEDFAGGVERASKTMTGLISNIMDQWSMFRVQVADAGLFDAVKIALSGVLDILNRNQQTIGAVAEIIGGVLVQGIQLAIEGAGFLADQWTLSKLGVAAFQVAILGVSAEVNKLATMTFEFLTELHRRAGDPLGIADELQRAQFAFRDASVETQLGFQVATEEMKLLAQEVGLGEKAAHKLNAQIDLARLGLLETSEGAERAAGGFADAADAAGDMADAVEATEDIDFDALGAELAAALEEVAVEFDEALTDMIKDATDTLVGLIESALPSGVSDVVSAAQAGAFLGGPAGAAAGATAALVTQSRQFAAVQERLAETFQKLANLAGALLSGIDPLLDLLDALVGTIASNLRPVLRALGSTLEALIAPFLELVPIVDASLGMWASALESMIAPVVRLANLLGSSLAPAFEGLGSIAESLAPLMDAVGTVFGVLSPLMRGMQAAIGAINLILSALQPVFSAFGQLLEGIATIISAIVDTIAGVWNGVIDAIAGVLNGLIDIIPGANDGLQSMVSALEDMKIALGDATESAKKSFDEPARAASENTSMVDENTAALVSMNEQLLNVPTGFKLAQTRFEAMSEEASKFVDIITGATIASTGVLQVVGLAGGGVVMQPTLAVVGEAGPEAVVPLDQAGGVGTNIVIQNLTVQANNPGELLDELNRVAQRRTIVSTGSSLLSQAPRFST